MNLRDEIEKLPTCDTPSWDDVVRRDDVLSILDEWELMGEHTSQKTGYIHIYDGGGDELTDNWHLTDMMRLNPGDHIAIYVRRGKVRLRDGQD